MARPGDEPLIQKSTTEARQGTTGQNVRVVLVVSLLGAIVVLSIVYFWFFSS
jgi:hypothetical protein